MSAGKVGGRAQSRLRLAIVLVGIALAVGIAGYFYRGRPTSAPMAQDRNGYVDPAVCVGCHKDVAATFRETGMGRSFRRVSSQTADADFTGASFEHKPSGKTYTMLTRDDALYMSRRAVGADGKPGESYEKRVDYVVGSGNHAHTYLHRTPEGKLMELPVSWYRETSGWAMSPGYDQPDQMDFRRAIGKDCMFCHNGYPANDPKPGNLTDGAVFAEKLPEGIDCQRCHGPGAEHVKLAQTKGADFEAVSAKIVNPIRLNRERQMDVCRQCHLETTSLPLPNMMRRFNRAMDSYRPGEPLTDYEMHFDHVPGAGFEDRVEVAHQAYRLQQSQCYLKSQMTCLTCHDPHKPYRSAEMQQHYIAACVGCHAAQHPAVKGEAAITTQTNCMTCHMPQRRTDDVIHVVMTDHKIQRFRPKRDLLAPLKEVIPTYQGEVVPYYPKLLSEMPQGELYTAVAQVAAGSNMKAGLPRLQKAIEEQKPQQPGFYFALASAYARAGDDTGSLRWYDEALKHGDDASSTLREYAAAMARANDLPSAAAMAEKAVAADAHDTVALTNLGNIDLRMGKSQEAQQTLARALAIDADLADANNLMGLAQLKLNDAQAAEAAFRKALLVDPDLTEAKSNLALLAANRGDMATAESLMKDVLRAHPDASAHRSYAMMLASQKQFGRAIEEMQQAIKLKPQQSDLYVDLGDLLVASGKIDQGRVQYMRAIQLDPKQAKAHVGMAQIMMAQNRTMDAEQEYRAAVSADEHNGEAQMALAELAARRGDRIAARQHLEAAAVSDDPQARQAAKAALAR